MIGSQLKVSLLCRPLCIPPLQFLSTSRSILVPSSSNLSNTTMPYTAIATIATMSTVGTRNGQAASRRRRQESSVMDADEDGFFYVFFKMLGKLSIFTVVGPGNKVHSSEPGAQDIVEVSFWPGLETG
jgi:hypothetical protein